MAKKGVKTGNFVKNWTFFEKKYSEGGKSKLSAGSPDPCTVSPELLDQEHHGGLHLHRRVLGNVLLSAATSESSAEKQ